MADVPAGLEAIVGPKGLRLADDLAGLDPGIDGANFHSDLMVLPAHEAPFFGLHVRISQILESHKRDLMSLFEYLEEPRRAVDCFPALFSRDIDQGSKGLATGETLANLNCLLGRRRITRSMDADGVNWYQQIPETAEYDD